MAEAVGQRWGGGRSRGDELPVETPPTSISVFHSYTLSSLSPLHSSLTAGHLTPNTDSAAPPPSPSPPASWRKAGERFCQASSAVCGSTGATAASRAVR